MTAPPPRCGYQWPENVDVALPDSHLRPHHCCWRKTWDEFDWCIWHAGTDAEKPVDELECHRKTPENHGHNCGGGRPAELLNGAHLSEGDLRAVGSFEACSLLKTDLSGAALKADPRV